MCVKRMAQPSNVYMALTFFIFLWITWLIFRAAGWPIDYETFYRAGQAVLSSGSPYQVNGGASYGPYLNGPLLALLMAPFALVPHALSIQLFQAFNLLSLSFTAWLTMRVMDHFRLVTPHLHQRSWFSIGLLFLAMTSVRETLLLSQVDILSMLGVALFLTGYTLHSSRTRGQTSWILPGLTLLFQVKLYLCLPLLLLLLIDRSILQLMVFAVTQLVIFLVSSWMAKSNLLAEWLTRLLHRQAATTNDSGQASLWSLWKRLPLPHDVIYFLAIACSLVIFLFFMRALVRVSAKNRENASEDIWRVGLALSGGLLLSSFAHETDFSVLAIPLAVLVVEERAVRGTRTLLASFAVSAGGFVFVSPPLFWIIQGISLTLFWAVTCRKREGMIAYIRFMVVTLFIGSLSVFILRAFGTTSTIWLDEAMMIIYALIIFVQSYRQLHRSPHL